MANKNSIGNSNQDFPKLTPSREAIKSLARSLYPVVKAFYDSEEGQKAFAEWKEKQNEQNRQDS
ncbi:MAG: hypothetical protein FWE86_01325 [Oscillospiraceae bacterium]|nr:hypothetical protein [Oscillospiraceae bacterium]